MSSTAPSVSLIRPLLPKLAPIGHSMAQHGSRLAVLAIMGAFCGPVLRVIGLLNRRLGIIASVFVMYPATEEYALKVVYRPWLRRRRWSPFPVMVFRQGGRWALVFAITATEQQIRSKGAAEGLGTLIARAKDLQRILGAKHLSFSGVLPGIFKRRGLDHQGAEGETTCRVVVDAIGKVLELEGLDETVPVLLIGGGGYIGSQVAASLGARKVYTVERDDALGELPTSVQGRPAIVVNIANRRALRKHVGAMWPGLILLNEVYPEPRKAEVAELAGRGIPAYHVVGVEARAFPPFPGAYRGGAPCCAAIPTAPLRAQVRRLAA